MGITILLATGVTDAAPTPVVPTGDKFTFVPSQKLVVVSPGVTNFSASELYSRWKEWVILPGNGGFSPVFSVVGGDPLGGGIFVASYFFLLNGWKIRPQEANHTLTISGNLSTEDGSNPVLHTLGAYNVLVKMVVPVQAQGVSSSGSISNITNNTTTITGPTDTQVANAVWASILESGLSAQAILRLLAAVAVGDATGLDGTQLAFKSLDGTRTRVEGTIAAGARTVTKRDGA